MPQEVADIAGWKLHAAGGFSRRVNSAAPTASAETTSEALAAVRSWFSERGLEFVARITPLAAHIDASLAGLGFTREGQTDVMTAFIDGNPVADVTVASEPSAKWMSAQARLQGVPAELIDSWQGIISRINSPAGFASIGDPEAIAAGFGVRYGRWLGLYEINVESDHRHRGLGRRLSDALLWWGASTGATRGYLQVVQDNHAARALYRSLGFTRAYQYWYRRAP